MTITPGGLLIAAGSFDEHDAEGSVQVWNLGSAALVKSYPVTAVAFSADGLSMARADFFPQDRVVISDLSTGRQRQSIPTHSSGAGSVSFSPDGKAIAVTDSATSQVKLWSVATGSELTTIPGEKAIGSTTLTTAAFSLDGKLLAAAPYGASSIKSWDLAAGRELRTFYGQGLVQGIAFSPDGRSLVAGSQQGLSVWDVAAGKRVATLFSGPVSMVVFSRDGRWLAANGGGRYAGETLKVWDMKSRTVAADFTFGAGGSPVASIAFVGAGSPLTTLGPFSRSWEFTVDGETHTVWSGMSPLAASPDEKLLAAQAGIGGSLDVWDMASGKKLTTLAALPVSISAVAFSGDGRWLMAAGAETRAIARDAAGTAVAAWGIKQPFLRTRVSSPSRNRGKSSRSWTLSAALRSGSSRARIHSPSTISSVRKTWPSVPMERCCFRERKTGFACGNSLVPDRAGQVGR